MLAAAAPCCPAGAAAAVPGLPAACAGLLWLGRMLTEGLLPRAGAATGAVCACDRARHGGNDGGGGGGVVMVVVVVQQTTDTMQRARVSERGVRCTPLEHHAACRRPHPPQHTHHGALKPSVGVRCHARACMQWDIARARARLSVGVVRVGSRPPGGGGVRQQAVDSACGRLWCAFITPLPRSSSSSESSLRGALNMAEPGWVCGAAQPRSFAPLRARDGTSTIRFRRCCFCVHV
jgi:hypothetical protein